MLPESRNRDRSRRKSASRLLHRSVSRRRTPCWASRTLQKVMDPAIQAGRRQDSVDDPEQYPVLSPWMCWLRPGRPHRLLSKNRRISHTCDGWAISSTDAMAVIRSEGTDHCPRPAPANDVGISRGENRMVCSDAFRSPIIHVRISEFRRTPIQQRRLFPFHMLCQLRDSFHFPAHLIYCPTMSQP
jgi:hypothetical protein